MRLEERLHVPQSYGSKEELVDILSNVPVSQSAPLEPGEHKLSANKGEGSLIKL